MSQKKLVVTLFILLLCLTSQDRIAPTAGAQVEETMRKGLQFRLSKGEEESTRPPAAPLSQAVPLAEDEVESLLKRVPVIKTETGDRQDFAFRDRSLPPPQSRECGFSLVPAVRILTSTRPGNSGAA